MMDSWPAAGLLVQPWKAVKGRGGSLTENCLPALLQNYDKSVLLRI